MAKGARLYEAILGDSPLLAELNRFKTAAASRLASGDRVGSPKPHQMPEACQAAWCEGVLRRPCVAFLASGAEGPHSRPPEAETSGRTYRVHGELELPPPPKATVRRWAQTIIWSVVRAGDVRREVGA